MKLSERAKDIEPEEHVSILNIKKVIEQQKAVNLALKMEREKNALKSDTLNQRKIIKNRSLFFERRVSIC